LVDIEGSWLEFSEFKETKFTLEFLRYKVIVILYDVDAIS